MNIKEKIAYREAMREMAEESQTMFNHYQDEVNIMTNDIVKYYQDRLMENANTQYIMIGKY